MSRPLDSPATGDLPGIWLDQGWQSSLVRPLLIALLAATLVTGPLSLAQLLAQDLSLAALLPLALLAALVGVYSTRWIVRPGQRLLHRALFRASEAILLLVLLRLATWAMTGDWPGLADLRQWILEPRSFFDLLYIFASLLCLLAWERGVSISHIFQNLALSPAELAWWAERQSGAWRRKFPVDLVRVSRSELAGSFATQWLAGGGLLVLCAGLSRLPLRSGGWRSLSALGLPPQLIAAIVAYFLIGLVLLSQTRLAMLRAQWLYEGVENLGAMPLRWQRLSLTVVLGIGLLATLLPLGSTWRLGEMLALLISVLTQIIYTVVFSLIGLLLAILSLLGVNSEALDMPPAPPASQPALPEAPPESVGSGLPLWLGGAGFWLVVAVIVLYAAVFILGKRGIKLNWATLRRWLALLKTKISNWWFGLRHLAASVQIGLPGKTNGESAESLARRQPWRFVRLGGLPPRAKIRYFYLSTVRRAGEKGIARRPSQTPLEFVRDLENAWPEAEMDVDALTGAFVSARYDERPIDAPQAKEVQSIWERVKRALRGRKSRD